MKRLAELVAGSRRAFGHGWHLPEYRQVELYTKKRRLAFAPPAAPEDEALPDTLGLHVALALLENHLAAADPALFEGKTSWQKYLALPRRHLRDKLVAEVYRILRVFRIAASHAQGSLTASDGLVRAACEFDRCALALTVTPAGLRLVESFVFCHLDSFDQPYGDAYMEALLTQYFVDIVAEIHKFADEDRVLYQFMPSFPWFNRHARLDCDNPRYTLDADCLKIEIGAQHADPARHAIDFYLPLDDALHIVPVEALRAGALALADLPAWRARTAGAALPNEFRARFGRETMIVGLPMT